MNARTCVICGHEGPDVVRRLAWYEPPLPSGPVQQVDGCRDTEACRVRCLAIGDTWPLGAPDFVRPPEAPDVPDF